MILPDDRDDAMRELLRLPRPSGVDAARAARVRRAVHAAWRDTADRARNRRRGFAIAAATVLGVAVTLRVDERPPDRKDEQRRGQEGNLSRRSREAT